MRKYIRICYTILFLSMTAWAEIIYVPSDFQIIQDAVNAAEEGDTVIVSPGKYEQRISIAGKNITLASQYLITGSMSDIDSTSLRYAMNNQSTVYCSGVDSTTVITGFTFGFNPYGFKGIECENAAPVIRGNIFYTGDDYAILSRGTSRPFIRDNKFLAGGSAYYACIDIRSGRAIIQNNILQGNTKISRYGIRTCNDETFHISGNEICNFWIGILDYGQKTEIINNLIYNCENGISCVDAVLVNNTVVDNFNYGVQNVMGGIPEIINCIVWGNKQDFSGTFSISNSCMRGCLPFSAIDNGGNVFRDPKFKNRSNHNYHLKGESPCIDSGTKLPDFIPKFDLSNNTRVSDGNGDTVAVIDMGCYERKQAVNPAYVSGKVTLSGGAVNVEGASVGIGSAIHPDMDGNYLLTISAPDSVYTVFASCDDYLEQEIENVHIQAGEITSNIDFNLPYYKPEEYHVILPDTLKFLSDIDYRKELKITNITLSDIFIRWIEPGSCMGFDPDSISFPLSIEKGNSCTIPLFLFLVTGSDRNEILSDSVIIFFNTDTSICPVLIDPTLLRGIEEGNNRQSEFFLGHNYPNPFNSHTTIEVTASIPGDIIIEIYDITGQKIRMLRRNVLNAGKHIFLWDGKDGGGDILSSGLYFYRLREKNNKRFNRMIMLK